MITYRKTFTTERFNTAFILRDQLSNESFLHIKQNTIDVNIIVKSAVEFSSAGSKMKPPE